MNQKKKDKVGFFSSISFKIILVVICAVLISNVVTLVLMLQNADKIVADSKKANMSAIQNGMLSMAEAYGETLNIMLENKGEDAPKVEIELKDGDTVIGKAELSTLSYEEYNEALGGVQVDGMSSSYAYLVWSDKTMMFHPTASKVGAPVTNSVVAGLASDIQAGKHPATACVSYEFKGAIKYASYMVLNDDSILVITADEDEALASVDKLSKELASLRVTLIILVVVIILVAAALAYVVSKMITKPITQISDIVGQTAALDFTHNANSEKLVSRKDETGMMARSVAEMRSALRTMVVDISEASKQINGNVEELKNISASINQVCTDNSATTEELAAGMQETSATTETINNNIGHMQNAANEIEDLSKSGETLSYEIQDRATKLKATTEEASTRTTAMYQEVKAKTDEAIEDSKAVNKINELTDAIMAISSQTSLLALNASIEAARAGEAGRGFAVVATEIGNLANQTSQTVGDINNIVKEVNAAVAKMTKSLEDTTEFLENVVIKDYAQFQEVSVQYSDDASVVQTSMKEIESSIQSLTGTISEIAEALNGINSTINEATIGVTDIASKTTDVVTETVQNNELVDDCVVSVGKLNEIAAMFKL